ncbi:hypothetical protein BKA69DRAFT_365388 [Paraphysoderma sedebokerense]|nr:hypothetical protein BKA69DRAFT_365388 [Paraphysoderma sedebokerense]
MYCSVRRIVRLDDFFITIGGSRSALGSLGMFSRVLDGCSGEGDEGCRICSISDCKRNFTPSISAISAAGL